MRSGSNALIVFLLISAFFGTNCAEKDPDSAEAFAVGIARPTIHLYGEAARTPPRYADLEETLTLANENLTLFDPFRGETTQCRGLRLSELVETWGSPACDRVTFTSLDGYRSTFLRKEWENQDIYFITHENDRRLGRDRLGPARIMTSSSDPVRSQTMAPRWIWQIQEIEFSPKPDRPSSNVPSSGNPSRD